MKPLWLFLFLLAYLSVSAQTLRKKSSVAGSRITVDAGFTAPDTVCVNDPVGIVNTSVGATNFYWNFCVANSTSMPVGTNIGNFGFTLPVFMDFAKDGNNYYGFVTNNMPGKLIRLDFGNSLLNVPSATDFGNLGGAIPNQCEGIQLVRNEGHWYAIIVGGQPVGRIVKVEFGAALSGTPVATNWGNIGGLAYPTDLHVFQDGAAWYGLTLNAQTNSITRFSFSASFSNVPTGVNLGNIGGLSYPTGIHAIKQGADWYAFITNAGSGSANAAASSLTRLSFGVSLLNTPTGINLGNPGNTFRSARDLTIYQSCDEIFGYVVNNSATSDLVRLNFNNSLITVPNAVSLGNTGQMNFPHSVSKLFRVENDLYSFVTNVDNNSITRLKFEGCNTASISSSTLQNPPAIRYSSPGAYNINLIVDDGLPTQAAFCKQVVVLPYTRTPVQRKAFCTGDSVLITARYNTKILWSTGNTTTSIFVKTPGSYWVRSTDVGGCENIDSFVVAETPWPTVSLGPDTAFCAGERLVLAAGNTGASFLWQDGQTTNSITITRPGSYWVRVLRDGCSASDTVSINMKPSPVVWVSNDTTICRAGTAQLTAGGAIDYTWSPAAGLSAAVGATVQASPAASQTYQVVGSNADGCTARDSVRITVQPQPVFSVRASKPLLCSADTAILSATGGDVYTWSPAAGLSHPSNSTTLAFPTASTRYKVVIEERYCRFVDSLFVDLRVGVAPAVSVSKSNDIDCRQREARLLAEGGSSYTWQPATGLSNPLVHNPVATPSATTTYFVTAKNSDGCEATDSTTVAVSGGDVSKGFFVPNAFTPNADGKNDCFGVRWGTVENFSMKLFNRWGEVVFQTTDPARCWDGMYKGVRQPNDAYVFLIEANTICGRVSRKGTFALIR